MTVEEIVKIAGLILASLGGGAGIVLAFSNWLGKIWASRLMERERHQYQADLEQLRAKLTRETEEEKIKFKKSELLFSKQLEAASEIVAYRQELKPIAERPSESDDEFFERMSFRVGGIAHWSHEYLSKYGAVLPDNVQHILIEVKAIAGESRFYHGNAVTGKEAINGTKQCYDLIQKVETELLSLVRVQAGA